MKRFTALSTIAILLFGGYIGYSTNYVEPATATEIVTPRFVDVPRNTGFNLDINLNKNTIACNDSPEQGVKVIIEKKDSIVYKYKYLIKYKEPKTRIVYVAPRVKQPKVSCIDVLNSYQTQKVEKINLHRD